MSRALAIVRTHQVGVAEARLAARFAEFFGDDVVLAVDASRKAPEVPPNFRRHLLIARDSLHALGLLPPENWGWRCGDCFYYAVAAAFPSYDFYWLVEPDVLFNIPDTSLFFGLFAHHTEDFLAAHFGPRGPRWEWTASIAPFSRQPHGCQFPLTRLSRRAIGALRVRRGDYDRRWPGLAPRAANDEAFVATTIAETPGFSAASLTDTAPALVSRETFANRPLLLTDDADRLPRAVLHPVLEKDAFLRKYRQRVLRSGMVEHYADLFARHFGATEQAAFQAFVVQLADAEAAAPAPRGEG